MTWFPTYPTTTFSFETFFFLFGVKDDLFTVNLPLIFFWKLCLVLNESPSTIFSLAAKEETLFFSFTLCLFQLETLKPFSPRTSLQSSASRFAWNISFLGWRKLFSNCTSLKFLIKVYGFSVKFVESALMIHYPIIQKFVHDNFGCTCSLWQIILL